MYFHVMTQDNAMKLFCPFKDRTRSICIGDSCMAWIQTKKDSESLKSEGFCSLICSQIHAAQIQKVIYDVKKEGTP